ncbi:PREDICTED: uncharacterized protein LOC108570025 [Nicrophorus vespilloides]|uniref:Uncharacterized protein LOC108570025 n=1 Tax=Nicrophorus vespilloides TaxID=110193 RepID=A0ABM1NKH5_NICVS|nr:PREDICTED: uncharacterized protein LOC108570025 [Nicrophorus vespilloides]
MMDYFRKAAFLHAILVIACSLQPSLSLPAGSSDVHYEDTVKEVEDLIQADPSLPRLTRGEILEILDNITKEESDLGSRDQKSIMVVMPYSPDSERNEDMQDLYTKPPVTHIIGDSGEEKSKKKKAPKTPLQTVKTTKLLPVTTETTTKYVTRKPESSTKIVYVTEAPETTKKFERHPNHKYPDEDKIFAQSSTKRPYRVKSTTQKPATRPEYVYRTKTTTQKPISNQGLNIITAPTLIPEAAKLINKKPVASPALVDTMQLPEDFKNVLKNLDTLIKENPEYSAQYEALSPLPTNPPYVETTTANADLQNVANNLSPDMKELLMNFGLIPDLNKKKVPSVQTKPFQSASLDINPNSYVSFKPLPESTMGSSDDGMDEFLAKFGLGGKNSQRSQKAISAQKPKNELDKGQFNLDMIPDHLKGVLADIGIQGKRNDQKSIPLHHQKGPNPIDFDSSVDKNEYKRQQSTTTTEKPAEPQNGSMKDLEDSFGGSSDVVKETVDVTTEAPKRTGFYYLVDWNTFLDIDNQKGKRVNLRFQPTIGDPKRFLSVSVP